MNLGTGYCLLGRHRPMRAALKPGTQGIDRKQGYHHDAQNDRL